MSLLLLNATIITGQGDLIERGGVVVEDGRIAAVGPAAQLEGRRNDPGTRAVDLQGLTLMPGIIDSHIHIAGGDFVPDREREPTGLAAFRTVEAAKRTLLAGITTVRVAGSRDFLDIDLRDAINAGAILGPRVIASGRGITITGGHYYNWCAMEADGVDGVRKAVREHIKRGADSIKLMLSPGIATQGAPVDSEAFSLEEAQVAVYEAHKVGRSVLSHSISLGSIRVGVEAGVDSIDHGYYLNEEWATKMRDKGIYYVPTLGPTHYYVHERLSEPWRIARAETVAPHHEEALKIALAVGVPIAMGCDCGAQSRMPNSANALEIVLLVRHGMSPMDALVTATRESATLTRIIDQVGTVEAGKIADLIALDRNPLDDIEAVRHNVRLVLQGGIPRRDDLSLLPDALS